MWALIAEKVHNAESICCSRAQSFTRVMYARRAARFLSNRLLLSLQGHYDYHYSYKSYDVKDGPYGQKFSNSVTYYYDNMSSNDLYSVDQDLLKDYIKRQMWV